MLNLDDMMNTSWMADASSTVPFEESETREDFSVFFNTLDDTEKQIVLLRYHGKTLEEVAEFIGVSTKGAVSKQIKRIYRKFTVFFREV